MRTFFDVDGFFVVEFFIILLSGRSRAQNARGTGFCARAAKRNDADFSCCTLLAIAGWLGIHSTKLGVSPLTGLWWRVCNDFKPLR